MIPLSHSRALAPRAPATPRRTDLTVRAWVLLLLDAMTRVAVPTISKLRYHRLAYIGNCLSALYGLRPADERILKHPRGPYYPDLQWHLDRLVGQNLAHVSAIRHFTDAHGSWMDARYSITRAGATVADELATIDSFRHLALFQIELARAYAAQEDGALDDFLLDDVTYADRRRALGSVVNFQPRRDNLSTQAAESFASLAPTPAAVTLADQVYLYVTYLDRLYLRHRRHDSNV